MLSDTKIILKKGPAMKRLCAAALLFLMACDNSDGPSGPAPQQQALAGVWSEVKDSGTVWFEGSSLTLGFQGNSLEIEESRWTDVSECVVNGSDTTCTDFSWLNSYRGSYALKGDVMELSFTYLATTADAPTANGKMTRGEFRVRYSLKEKDPPELILESIDRELPLAGKDRIVLKRVEAP
jgi:hypothetical protein